MVASELYMKPELKMLSDVSDGSHLFTEVALTTDRETNCGAAGHRQKNCSRRVLEQEAREREGRDIRGHLENDLYYANAELPCNG